MDFDRGDRFSGLEVLCNELRCGYLEIKLEMFVCLFGHIGRDRNDERSSTGLESVLSDFSSVVLLRGFCEISVKEFEGFYNTFCLQFTLGLNVFRRGFSMDSDTKI